MFVCILVLIFTLSTLLVAIPVHISKTQPVLTQEKVIVTEVTYDNGLFLVSFATKTFKKITVSSKPLYDKVLKGDEFVAEIEIVNKEVTFISLFSGYESIAENLKPTVVLAKKFKTERQIV